MAKSSRNFKQDIKANLFHPDRKDCHYHTETHNHHYKTNHHDQPSSIEALKQMCKGKETSKKCQNPCVPCEEK